MAWWISRSSAYAGPGFDWVDPASVAEQRGLSRSGLSLSRPISTENVPKIGRYRQPFAAPPVADVLLVSSAVVVNERFKNLVEEFEPDIHFFAPIQLQYNDGRPIDGEFYYFNCNLDIDCILTENHDLWFRNVNRKIISHIKHIRSGSPIEIKLSKPTTFGYHLWTGGPLGWNQLFVSDIFFDAMRDSHITEFETRKYCREIDQPWAAEANMGPLLEKWRNYVANDRNVEMGYL